MRLNICIIGNDGAGKSTLAAKIADSIVNDAKVVSFATPLKSNLLNIGVPTNAKPYSSEVRSFVRAYGDLMRSIHGSGFWAEQLLSDIATETKSTIVDDMRYWSEFNAWTSAFGKSTKVITVGPIVATNSNDAQSIIQVNELLRVLRQDKSSNMLHLPDIKTMPQELVDVQLNKYLNNK